MSLRALLRDICTGIEIYYTGRSEGEYLKAAFVLCDDYTELTSKLWLLTNDKNWSGTHDKEARKLEQARKKVAAMARGEAGTTATPEEIALVENGGRFDKFKAYDEVLNDVGKVFQTKRPRDVAALDALQRPMKARRKQRNDLFHSAKLLSLTTSKTECVEAFCDLLDYGRLLFGALWNTELGGARNLATLEVMLRLEARSGSNPALQSKIDRIFQNWRRNESAKPKGSMVVHFSNDLYYRLCVIHGNSELRLQLESLLQSLP